MRQDRRTLLKSVGKLATASVGAVALGIKGTQVASASVCIGCPCSDLCLHSYHCRKTNGQCVKQWVQTQVNWLGQCNSNICKHIQTVGVAGPCGSWTACYYN